MREIYSATAVQAETMVGEAILPVVASFTQSVETNYS